MCMKILKKISVTPLAHNGGDIIDSFNTSDDKTINAPSIHAVEQNCKLKGDFAVITGTMDLDANSSEQALNNKVTTTSKTIDYPQGFNANNSVLLSYGRKDGDNFGTSYGWTNYITSSEMLRGIVPMNVQLFGESTTDYANKILIQMGNMNTSTKTVTYKIVLMKVS